MTTLKQRIGAKEKAHQKKFSAKPSGIDLDKISPIRLLDYFNGSWDNFIEQFPGAAYHFAMHNKSPGLFMALLKRYGNYQSIKDFRLCKKLRERYSRLHLLEPEKVNGIYPLGLGENLVYVGSTCNDQLDHGLSWRQQNGSDNAARAIEDRF